MIFFNKFRLIYFLIFLFTCLFCFNPSNNISENEKYEKKILERIYNIITNMHFSSKPIDDTFSKKVFRTYFKLLDPYKRNFKQSDFNEFKKYEFKLDDYFQNGNLDFYNLTINRYIQRIYESEKIVDSILKNPIELESDEYLIMDEKDRKYSINNKIYSEEWKYFLKYLILNSIQTIKDTKKYNNQVSNLHNTNELLIKRKEFPTRNSNGKLSFNQIKNLAIVEVKETMNDYFRRIKSRKRIDYFSIYLNAFTETFDPHTAYLSPKEAKQFNSKISGKIIGIGAQLQDKNGYPTFMELVIGGPAWKSQKIDVGDKILKVGEANEKFKNVVGMLLEDVIQLIRGNKKSKVNLVIQKKDGRIKIVSLIRQEIELEEILAKSAIIENNKKEKFGIIYLPEFYADLENQKSSKNCSEDFKKEILKLKKENIKGLIVDLRGNGGGSLAEVIKIVGYFISEGPVVRVRHSDGYEQVYKDTDQEVLYDGSLIVVVDEFSASAAEIFAAAIQDYKRGIILGAPKTFGKGTVQSLIPLEWVNNDYSSSSSRYGVLKITIQKFYRINGGSTQIKGVTPDIPLASSYQYLEISESYQDNPLPWDSIQPSQYTSWKQKINYNLIKSNSKKRTQDHIFLLKLKEQSKWIKFINQKKISLNYKKFIKDSNFKNQIIKKYERELDYKTQIQIFYPILDKKKFLKIKNKIIFLDKDKKWHRQLSKDFYINESIQIFNDI